MFVLQRGSRKRRHACVVTMNTIITEKERVKFKREITSTKSQSTYIDLVVTSEYCSF